MMALAGTPVTTSHFERGRFDVGVCAPWEFVGVSWRVLGNPSEPLSEPFGSRSATAVRHLNMTYMPAYIPKLPSTSYPWNQCGSIAMI